MLVRELIEMLQNVKPTCEIYLEVDAGDYIYEVQQVDVNNESEYIYLRCPSVV